MIMIKTRIFILTFCKYPQSLFGNLLTFKTVRTGFKDAEIIVYDNNSIDEARKEIKLAAKNIGAIYKQYDRDVTHQDFLKHQIENNKDGHRLIFLDPDLVFWDSFDDFNSDGLMVGREIPRFFDTINKIKTLERLHTSFLIINDTEKLLSVINPIQKKNPDCMFYRPYTFFLDNECYRFDTMSSLYSVIKDQCKIFTEKELDKYDHIFCGTHLYQMAQQTLINNNLLDDEPGGWLYEVRNVHIKAREDINKIKGIWRHQQKLILANKF